MHDSTTGPRCHVAYLNSHYPALSHTFIEREIAAVREQGIDVETFSVRASPPADLLSRTMREEAARTYVLLGGDVKGWVQAHTTLVRNHPGAGARAAAQAVRSGDNNAKARLWQAFYYGEAVVLHHQMRAAGLRHVHVHHANVSADVARLVCRLGDSIDGAGSWTWSLTVHGSAEFENIRQWDLAAKVRQAKAVACISDYCRGQLMRLVEPEHWHKIHLVRMSVDPEKYQPPSRPREHGGPLRLLAVGRLVALKGFQVLVDACGLLRERGVGVEVRIVGQGPDESSLRRCIEQAGLQQVAHLVGPVGQDHIVEHYRWADAYLMTSFMEGLPVVVMEAMSTELPVVATEVAAMSELIENDRNGVLVRMGRPDLLADAVQRLVAEPQARRAMGTAARQTVLAEFTPRTAGPAMAAVLRAVTGAPTPPAPGPG